MTTYVVPMQQDRAPCLRTAVPTWRDLGALRPLVAVVRSGPVLFFPLYIRYNAGR